MAIPNSAIDGETTVATLSPNAGVGGDKVAAEIKTAPSPFDNQYGDADIVLRTADETDFYVHKNILRMSSAFFQTMFSLPQPLEDPRKPADEGPVLHSSAKLDVLPVSEDSRALNSVLRWCYPEKYEMEHVVRKLTKKLRTLRHHRPLEVFAEAFYRDLEDIAADAADSFCYPSLPPTYEKRKQMPTYPIGLYSLHMNDVPASLYFRLLEHHHKVASVPDPRKIPYFCLPSKSSVITEHGPMGQQRSSPVSPSHPFHDDPRANVLVCSADGCQFFVIANLLSYSSTVLEQMLNAADTTPDNATRDHPLDRQLGLPEDGQTLALLLQLCYPAPDPDLAHGSIEEKLADLSRLLDAARKYKVARAVDFVQHQFIAIASEVSPMRLYFTASWQKWQDGMREAAVHCVYEVADEYVPEMELGTAAEYRRLLVYRQKCREIILARYDPMPVPTQGSRPAHAKYFSKESWLSEPSDVRFWLAVHRRVHENVSAARDPTFNVEALYASFARAGSLQHGTNGRGNKMPSLQDLLEASGELGQVQF